MFRVYDDRDNRTIIISENVFEASIFMSQNYKEDHPDFSHIWLEEIKEEG